MFLLTSSSFNSMFINSPSSLSNACKFLFPYSSVNVPLVGWIAMLPLHSLKFFPVWRNSSSKFDNVIVYSTVFFPVDASVVSLTALIVFVTL